MAKCHYCGGNGRTKDHIIPKALHGPDATWNIINACHDCNLAKGHLTYEVFMGTDTLPQQCIDAGFRTTGQWVDQLREYLAKFKTKIPSAARMREIRSQTEHLRSMPVPVPTLPPPVPPAPPKTRKSKAPKHVGELDFDHPNYHNGNRNRAMVDHPAYVGPTPQEDIEGWRTGRWRH